MLWVLLDVAIGVLALLLLVLVGLLLYRRVRGLMRVGKAASAAVSASMPAPPAPRRSTT